MYATSVALYTRVRSYIMAASIWTKYIFNTTEYIEQLTRIGYGFTLVGYDLVNARKNKLDTDICLTLIITKDNKCIGMDDAYEWIINYIRCGNKAEIFRNDDHYIHRSYIRHRKVQLYIPALSQRRSKKIRLDESWSTSTLCPRHLQPGDYPNYTCYMRFLKDQHVRAVPFGNFQFYSGRIKYNELFHIEGTIRVPSFINKDEDEDICTTYIVIFDKLTLE